MFPAVRTAPCNAPFFERVMEHVRTGRFVPVGGMWVESDTNMVGGEAMVRQLLHGKAWMREHLGVDCEEVWLPDSFGYTAHSPRSSGWPASAGS